MVPGKVRARVAIVDGDRTVLPNTEGEIPNTASVVNPEGKISVSWSWGIAQGGVKQLIQASAAPGDLLAADE
jgi:hypothetical protein